MRLSAQESFAELCMLYRAPLLAFLQRKRFATTDAEDAVQEFFAQLNATRALSPRGPEHGTFRSYLLGAFKHHLSNARRHDNAQKRGGHVQVDSLDDRGDVEVEPGLPAELAYERAWAIAMLEQSVSQVELRYVREGRGALFHALKRLLDAEAGKHAEVARELGVSEPTLRVALHRLRKRLAKEVRVVVAKTVAEPDDVEPEVQHLASVLWQTGWSL